MGSFIVQGNKNSGALLTAKYALEQNRDLFALPGDINRATSEGPNHLIKNGAKLVSSYLDILEEYELVMTSQPSLIHSLTPKEKEILKHLQEEKPFITYDKLVEKSGFNVGELSTVLLSLELKNLIRMGDGSSISSID